MRCSMNQIPGTGGDYDIDIEAETSLEPMDPGDAVDSMME